MKERKRIWKEQLLVYHCPVQTTLHWLHTPSAPCLWSRYTWTLFNHSTICADSLWSTSISHIQQECATTLHRSLPAIGRLRKGIAHLDLLQPFWVDTSSYTFSPFGSLWSLQYLREFRTFFYLMPWIAEQTNLVQLFWLLMIVKAQMLRMLSLLNWVQSRYQSLTDYCPRQSCHLWGGHCELLRPPDFCILWYWLVLYQPETFIDVIACHCIGGATCIWSVAIHKISGFNRTFSEFVNSL